MHIRRLYVALIVVALTLLVILIAGLNPTLVSTSHGPLATATN